MAQLSGGTVLGFAAAPLEDGAGIETSHTYCGWTKFSHHVETMVETIVCWHLQVNHHSRWCSRIPRAWPEEKFGPLFSDGSKALLEV